MAAIMVVGATLGAISPASAQARPNTVRPDGCPTNYGYEVSGVKGTFVPDARKRVYGGPGVTLSISAASGTTWTGTITSATQADISAIVAEAKETITGSISYSKTTTVTISGSWKVPSSQRSGWLALGSEGYRMNWQEGYNTGSCTWVKVKSGTAVLPAQAPFIGHS